MSGMPSLSSSGSVLLPRPSPSLSCCSVGSKGKVSFGKGVPSPSRSACAATVGVPSSRVWRASRAPSRLSTVSGAGSASAGPARRSVRSAPPTELAARARSRRPRLPSCERACAGSGATRRPSRWAAAAVRASSVRSRAGSITAVSVRSSSARVRVPSKAGATRASVRSARVPASSRPLSAKNAPLTARLVIATGSASAASRAAACWTAASLRRFSRPSVSKAVGTSATDRSFWSRP